MTSKPWQCLLGVGSSSGRMDRVTDIGGAG
jgi:hypothetical protein